MVMSLLRIGKQMSYFYSFIHHFFIHFLFITFIHQENERMVMSL